ncbi:MAG: dihydropteroate synthase [Planctomycetales bacterium]|nr:dihydropteroate synthase [Planctomycetales bacterium]
MPRERILFVTGRLAEFALRRVVEELSRHADFEYDVAVLGLSVAALMHVDLVRRRLPNEAVVGIDRVVLPGWCQGDLEQLAAQWSGCRFERGPKDLHDLPEYFGKLRKEKPALDRYDIEILAEINHAPRLSDAEIRRQAEAFRASGADVIDLGCVPGESWHRVGDVTRQLRDAGLRVSIDSFDRIEVETAVAAGAELVLSCNGTNREWAASLPAEFVAIPDTPRDLASLDDTIACLRERGAKFRVDPVVEPIGFGFAASLERFLDVRRRYPDVEMLMGIGNLTELTEVDSAGVNMLLAGFCQELGIRSVLTTEVINWCRSAVREFDLARRLTWHSVHNHVLPKHVDSRLVMLRDPKSPSFSEQELAGLAEQIKDPNFRIFAERGEIHLMNRDGYWHGTDPFALIEQAGPLDAPHAFYLGYEMCKAVTALTLGKVYRQDEPLSWGFLTRPEISIHDRRKSAGGEIESCS